MISKSYLLNTLAHSGCDVVFPDRTQPDKSVPLCGQLIIMKCVSGSKHDDRKNP